MRRQTKQHNQAGFTIVEFMIATTIFSLVILLCSMAIIHVGRMYYKGVITNRTQDTARRVIEDITESIQFGPSSTDPLQFVMQSAPVTINNVTMRAYCVGGDRYTYTLNAALGSTSGQQGDVVWSRHVLWKDRFTGTCSPANLTDGNLSGGQEMLGTNMRLSIFEIARPADITRPWGIDIRVAYGDTPDLFADGNSFGICKGVIAGGQFCAVSALQTSVTKRL